MNVEEILLKNNNLKQFLPEIIPFWEQWELSVKHSFLRNMGKQALLHILDILSELDISKLEEHFDDKIIIHKFDKGGIYNIECNLHDLEVVLETIPNRSTTLIHRDDNKIKITYWR